MTILLIFCAPLPPGLTTGTPLFVQLVTELVLVSEITVADLATRMKQVRLDPAPDGFWKLNWPQGRYAMPVTFALLFDLTKLGL